MRFKSLWQEIVSRKKTTLCVGIDPALPNQRSSLNIDQGEDKVEWTIKMIEMVAAHSAAIKLNRNYYKDTDQSSLKKINECIHAHNLLSIDDSKLADIGSSNDAGLYHAKSQGFDAVTYAPFPGNISETAKYAKARDIALIMLVKMSNPEFIPISAALVDGVPMTTFLARELARNDIDGMVVGAPSPNNGISKEELASIDEASGNNRLALVPGIGIQGGKIDEIIEIFSTRAILNVGRSITYSDNPTQTASEFHQQIRSRLKI